MDGIEVEKLGEREGERGNNWAPTKSKAFLFIANDCIRVFFEVIIHLLLFL